MINFKTVKERASRLSQDRKGSIAIIFSAALFPVIFAAGAAIDYGNAMRAKSSLQAATDSAALAGSTLLAANPEARRALATTVFNANMPNWMRNSATATVVATMDNVTVTGNYVVRTAFTGIGGIHNLPLEARANVLIDTTVTDGNVCLLALNTTNAVKGINLSGNTTIADEKCWAWSNSTASNSLYAWGSSDATAAGFCSAGNYQGGSRFQPTPLTNCAQRPDPFPTLAMPTVGSCDYNDKKYQDVTEAVVPNASGITVFCNGLEIKQSTVTFPAGIYIIKDSTFLIRAQGKVIGDNVVFIFSGANAKILLNGGGDAQLKAPTVAAAAASAVLAPYAGFLFVDDRNNKPTSIPILLGGGVVKMEGILYMPSRAVQIGGNGQINQNAKYWSMIADRFELDGTGDMFMKTDFATAGFPDILPKVKRLTRMTQ